MRTNRAFVCGQWEIRPQNCQNQRLNFLSALPVILAFRFRKQTQIIHVAQFADFAIGDRFAHGATGFFAVGARPAEATFVGFGKKLAKAVGNVQHIFVVEAQQFDPRRIDEVAAKGERKHLGKGRGMLPLPRVIADLARPQLQLLLYGVDQGAFAHAGLARNQGRFVF